MARVGLDVAANAHQTLAVLVEHVLEADDNALKVRLAALANVVADLAQVDVVQCGIDYNAKTIMLVDSSSNSNNTTKDVSKERRTFIHDEKWRGMKAVNRKQKG